MCFPSLVPTSTEDPEAGNNKNAWGVLMQWNKPTLTLFSDSDPITKGGHKAFQKFVPGAKNQAHTNVLKFRQKTEAGNETGIEAYMRYGLNALPFIKKHGAQLIWRGQVKSTLIGDDQDQAHVVLLVRYPALQNFIEMTSDPEYVKISKDRTIALEYGGPPGLYSFCAVGELCIINS